jgi:phosphoribosylaminoimidazole carboxylase/phosphoribosylaminoimidazole-succinocarboxamide synthase
MEQILAKNFTYGSTVIGRTEYDKMAAMTVAIFEILEKAWSSLDCSLIDMKIEFGVDKNTGKIVDYSIKIIQITFYCIGFKLNFTLH